MLIKQLIDRLSFCLDVESTDDWIKTCISNPLPISPWSLWTLCSLVKHHQRQKFVADVVQYRLGGDLEAIARGGYSGHPPIPCTGLVPNLTEWEYDLHGRGCCLTHRLTGESIDVDFYDNVSDWFDDFFYSHYLKCLKQSEIWEYRVIELHSSFDTVFLAITELLETGLLEKHKKHKVFRLGFDADLINQTLEQIETACKSPDKLILIAAALGDWGYVQELSSSDQIIDSVADQKKRTVAKREERLIQLFDTEDHNQLALKGLVELDSARQREFIKRTFEGPESSVSSAFEIIEKTNDGTWCNEVIALLKRINPDGKHSYPFLWIRSLEYLLRHDYFDKESIRQMLLNTKSYSLAEAAVIALEHFPQEAIQIFKKALRSPIPYNRVLASSVLAILDQPWSLREMVIILEESDEQESTAACRAALRETHHKEIHEIVNQWESNNSQEAGRTEWISVEESMLHNVQYDIRWEMEEWHDRITLLRNALPPESS